MGCTSLTKWDAHASIRTCGCDWWAVRKQFIYKVNAMVCFSSCSCCFILEIQTLVCHFLSM